MKKSIVIIAAVLFLLLAWLASTRIHFIHHPQVLYIGDSLCEGTHDGEGLALTQIASIARDCIGGRKSVDYGDLPQGKTIIFYALGTNDMGAVEPAVYADDLQRKLQASDARWLVCVLPDPHKPGAEPYRLAMQARCPQTIEPREHGYWFSAADGIHGNVDDHRRFGEWLNGHVDQLLEQQPWQQTR